MLAKQLRHQLKNQKGMAIFEIIPILIIIVMLVNFSLGFFGAIHTGILNSMAARNYAFETFRHRSNLTYLRPGVEVGDSVSYEKTGLRIHATISDNNKGDNGHFIATGRPIDFLAQQEVAGSKDTHNNRVHEVKDGKRYTENGGVNPLWVRPQYGICLNAKCGAKN